MNAEGRNEIERRTISATRGCRAKRGGESPSYPLPTVRRHGGGRRFEEIAITGVDGLVGVLAGGGGDGDRGRRGGD